MNNAIAALVKEASLLAELVNRARFEEQALDAEQTVRLCELLDKIEAELELAA